ncbi:S66 peptidase family protein [Leptolyngbya sp. Cla-17]|uniref:S66 peptidase family protein n=1 Tax=Leptolyngbya sp. Cla-17 TaxID=2803751 RepID=UPI0014917BAF|nr:LD-carboxypeptidase [Leptolyngbya sp. Cla-17]
MTLDLFRHRPSRRQFLQVTTGGIAAGALSAAMPDDATAGLSVLKPPILRPGDTVGMVAPASNAYEPEEIAIAKETMEQYGFKVVLGRNITAQNGYLAGTDAQRAADVNEMFRRADVRGIVTFSGGYGCSRILPLLDYEQIRRSPKVIVGHSDITALLVGINRKTGLVTFHGSSGLTGVGDYAMEHFRRAMMSTGAIGEVAKPPNSVAGTIERTNRLITIFPGRATGQLVGGNLTLITNLIGTPFEPDTTGKILFLEEIGEEPYRIDRMLTQLWLAGKLQAAAGIALGRFVDCYPKEYQASFPQTISLENVLRDRFEPLKKPTLYNLMFGHVRENAVLPIGAIATLDATAKTLTVNENAVRAS